MKICFIGNFEVPYSSENHYKTTLEQLGHTVIPIQENTTVESAVMNKSILCDMLFHVHTHGDTWNIKGIENVYKQLKAKHIPTVGYHLDLFKGISREINLNTDPYWNIEFFFTADKNFVPDLEAKGIKAYYLPAGVLENECYLAEPDYNRFPHEVIFVGSKGYHHEYPYRPQLINWLQETYGSRFGHYGGDGLGTIRGNDLNVLYSSAKVVVGDTLCKDFKYSNYFSDRLFETTGRGGFMIFPYIKGIHDFFKYDEIVTYKLGDFGDLRDKIDFYLENNERRERLKLRAHLKTKSNHTYRNRLSYLLKTINENKSK